MEATLFLNSPIFIGCRWAYHLTFSSNTLPLSYRFGMGDGWNGLRSLWKAWRGPLYRITSSCVRSLACCWTLTLPLLRWPLKPHTETHAGGRPVGYFYTNHNIWDLRSLQKLSRAQITIAWSHIPATGFGHISPLGLWRSLRALTSEKPLMKTVWTNVC